MISLVLATYNGEKYILEQLESIKNQTLKPDEVIICDDKSTDNTFSMISEYIKENKLSWLLYVNDNNQGYSRNFSNLIKKAKGDIIFLADQDDIWFLDKIERMSKIIEENQKISLLASNILPFYVGHNPQKINFEKFRENKKIIKIDDKLKWIKPIRPGCSMCIRPSKFSEYDEIWYDKYPHDCLLWGISVLNDGAYLLNEETIKFRRHDNNTSSRGGRTSDNRIRTIGREIEYIKRMLEYQKKKNNKNITKLLEKQLDVYIKREKGLKKCNVFQIIFLFPKIRYFGRCRFWLTDIYYCIKRR